jgi:hypothetical protein
LAQFGRTPLSVASGHGHTPLVTLLLERGAEVNTKSTVRRPHAPRGVRGVRASGVLRCRCNCQPLLRSQCRLRAAPHAGMPPQGSTCVARSAPYAGTRRRVQRGSELCCGTGSGAGAGAAGTAVCCSVLPRLLRCGIRLCVLRCAAD